MLPFDAVPEFDFDEELVLALEEWEALSTSVNMEVVWENEEERRKVLGAVRKLNDYLEGVGGPVTEDEVREHYEVLKMAMKKLREKDFSPPM